MAAVDITTIGIEYDTSGLDKGTRAQDKTRDSANKLGDSIDKTEKSFSSLNKILGIAAGAMAASAMGTIVFHIDTTASMKREQRMELTKQVLLRVIPGIIYQAR